MRLTTHTDYALRTLMYLAVRDEGLATIADIAAAYRISHTHLMKVVHELGLAGYIHTVRGRQGGMRLARPAEQIRIGELVRRTENDLALATCFGDGGACALEPGCVLQAALYQALAAFLDVLDRYTLADLVQRRQRLAVLLGIVESGGEQARL